jgi:crotonobetainyl-CoA:carnitine CoA-transferase CaiB-like acyl-CoA transferase
MNTSALSGLRVLDLTRLAAGGMLGMLLADFGADVVKVEQPGVGDPLRRWTTEGQPLWWRVYGRNKRSITLNLQTPAGQQLFAELVPRFDVLLESFVPGTLEKWRLSSAVLQAWNPRLIIARISGWGQSGPGSNRPGFGTLAEAASGLAAMTGDAAGPPVLPPIALADMVTALYACNGILMALRHRETSGVGQVIDAALFESIFSILGPTAAEYAVSGQVNVRGGNSNAPSAPRGTFLTRDGEWIAVSGATPVMAARFMAAYGLAHLLDDERFATNEARRIHAAELNAAIGEQVGARTLAENVQLIEQHNLTAVAVQTIADIERDAHWQARKFLFDFGDAQGSETNSVRMHAPLPRLSETPGQVSWAGRAMGADNAAIYSDELGRSADALAKLSDAGVI